MIRLSRVMCAASGSGAPSVKFQVAIIGSGPGGFYVAQHLLKKRDDIHVDIFERFPVPFGLSRYGVAPDHPEVKNVEKTFMQLLEARAQDVTLLTNMEIGRRGLPVKALLDHYHAVVVAHGAAAEKRLGLSGERLGNVMAAKNFVEYYNTYPAPYASPLTSPIDLRTARRVLIIGNGNVALDCARVLAAPYKHFCTTDMNCFAIRELMQSAVEEVIVVGRRAVEHSAFTTKEFRELATLSKTVRVEVEPFDLQDAIARSKHLRGKQRQLELLHKFCPGNSGAPVPKASEDVKAVHLDDPTARPIAFDVLKASREAPPHDEGAAPKVSDIRCSVRFAYNLTPVAFHPAKENKYRAASVEFRRSDGTKVLIECDAVLCSLGYLSEPLPDVPFDEQQGIIPNKAGRVDGVPRLYCAGWAKTGPKGVIASTLVSSAETAECISNDLRSLEGHRGPHDDAGSSAATMAAEGTSAPTAEDTAETLPPGASGTGKYGLIDTMIAKKLMPLTYSQVKKIWHLERLKGVDLGKAAEKIPTVQDMIDIAGEGRAARRATQRVTGKAPARPRGLELLEDWLDPDVEIADLSNPQRVDPSMNPRL